MGAQVWDRRAAAETEHWRSLATGRRLVRVTRGQYVSREAADDFSARCAAVLAAVPHARLSHWTALRAHGLPVPPGMGADVHVSVARGRTEPRCAGVVCHVTRGSVRLQSVGGLSVVPAPVSWCDVAASGAELRDLVAAGDVLWRHEPTTPRDLSVELATRLGKRGVVRARQALALLDRRAESAMESWLRVLLVGAGLLPSGVNTVVVDSRTGRFLARVDLAWEAARVIVEYDGDHHRDRRQWQADLLRREALEADGWCVIVVTARDLLGHPDAVVRRVRDRLSARGHPAS